MLARLSLFLALFFFAASSYAAEGNYGCGDGTYESIQNYCGDPNTPAYSGYGYQTFNRTRTRYRYSTSIFIDCRQICVGGNCSGGDPAWANAAICGVTCPAGSTLGPNGTCLDDVIECPDGQVESDGQCVDAGNICQDSETFHGGDAQFCCPIGQAPTSTGGGSLDQCGCPDLPQSSQTGVCAENPTEIPPTCDAEMDSCVAQCGSNGIAGFQCDTDSPAATACSCGAPPDNGEGCPAGTVYGSVNDSFGCYPSGEGDGSDGSGSSGSGEGTDGGSGGGSSGSGSGSGNGSGEGSGDSGSGSGSGGSGSGAGSGDGSGDDSGSTGSGSGSQNCSVSQIYGTKDGVAGCYSPTGTCPAGQTYGELDGTIGCHGSATGTSAICQDSDGDGFDDITNVDMNGCTNGTNQSLTAEVDTSGIESRLDKINDHLKGDAPGAGSSTALSDSIAELDVKMTEVKATISSQMASIRAELSEMFDTASGQTGAGSLPCYAPIHVIGQDIQICFTEFEDDLSIVGSLMFGFSFVWAAFIILGGSGKE